MVHIWQLYFSMKFDGFKPFLVEGKYKFTKFKSKWKNAIHK